MIIKMYNYIFKINIKYFNYIVMEFGLELNKTNSKVKNLLYQIH